MLNTIVVRNLSKIIETPTHRVEILKDINFEVPSAQVVAITGASGSGKSTLLGLLAGLDWPTSGSILLDGTDIVKLSEDQLATVRGQKIGFVFQAYQLIPTLNALENVLLPAELAGNGFAGALERAKFLLDGVGLHARQDHYPAQLSGGEQQRVALARAFMMKPSVLLADEPTGNLDTTNGRHVLDLMLKMNREQGTTLVLVTHDHELTRHCDRRISLRDGQVIGDDKL